MRSIPHCSATLAALALAAPMLEYVRSPVARPLYRLLSFICHQIPSRSLFIAGSNAGLCFRCMAMYAALAAATAFPLGTMIQRLGRGFHGLLHVPLARSISAVKGLFILMLIADGLLPILGWPPSTNTRRIVTGFLGGWAIGSFVMKPNSTSERRVAMAISRKVVTVLLSASVAAQPSPLALGADQVAPLRGGTPVFLVFDRSVDSEAANEGDTIYLRVLRPVVVDDAVVIRSGENARAKIIEIKKAKGWGTGGNLTVRVDSTTAVDGQEVPLRGVQRHEGEGKVGTATAVGVGAGLLCLPAVLFGFAVKGEEGRIPIAHEVKAYVDQDQKITLAGVDQPSPAEEMLRARDLQEQIEKEAQRQKEEQAKKEEERRQKEHPRL
ncbi:MAG: DUF2085 domain-containing protein [bacterium]